MTISSSFGATMEYSGSALRFGLVDIKPIEVVETIKRFGIKFRKTSRMLESLRPSQSYADFVTLQNEAVFNKIDTPNWFATEELVEISSRRSIKRYEEDAELQEIIKELKSSDTIGRPLLRFTRFIRNRFESNREQSVAAEAVKFLNSNFPMSFYSKFVVFDNVIYDFLKIIEQIVRVYEFRARATRNFQMYSRQIDEMKKKIGPFIDQMDACLFTALCLEKYVSVWNAKTYEEIERPKFLDINKIDRQKFEQLYSDFNLRLAETRQFLFKYDPNFLQKELHLETEPAAKMFGKLVMLPLSSLSLER